MATPMIIVSAPSGAGKSTLCNKALEDFPVLLSSISHTTREPRDGETDGDPYFFVTKKRFRQMIHEDLFAEWAMVHESYYGTSKAQIQSIWNRKKCVLMDIDVQGVQILKQQYPKAHTIFILPPSLAELEKRLKTRDCNTTNLDVRLQNAQKEINQADSYDHQITNDHLNRAYVKFQQIISQILKTIHIS